MAIPKITFVEDFWDIQTPFFLYSVLIYATIHSSNNLLTLDRSIISILKRFKKYFNKT